MAKFQMQIVFTEDDKKRQRIRELKSVVKDVLEGDKEYLAAKEKYVNARASLTSRKGAASLNLGSELDEIQGLKQELKTSEEAISIEALKMLQKGESVELVNAKGVKMTAELHVRFRKAKDAGEED